MIQCHSVTPQKASIIIVMLSVSIFTLTVTFLSLGHVRAFFFLLHYNLSVPLSLQYRRFVFSLPSMCGSSGASVVSKRITRRQYKRRRVKEQERLREDEDILNGKLNNSKHFIEAQTSYFPLLHLRLCTLLLHLSNYRVCYKFPLSS